MSGAFPPGSFLICFQPNENRYVYNSIAEFPAVFEAETVWQAERLEIPEKTHIFEKIFWKTVSNETGFIKIAHYVDNMEKYFKNGANLE